MTGSHSERRRFARRNCSLRVQLKAPELPFPTSCETTDISLCGCYVKLSFPLPIATVVDVLIAAGDAEVQTKGVVRTLNPGLGNGIEFTEMTEDNRLRLEQCIERLPDVEASDFIP